LPFDQKLEQERTRYNEAIAALERPDNSHREKSVESIEKLAKEKFPAAMYSLAMWQIAGEEGISKDPAGGLALLQKAAKENYGPALFQIASRLIKGQDFPVDLERGLKMMQEAATLGSRSAEYYLGQAYRDGIAVPRDPERVKRYFRLCAAGGVPRCQLLLGNLLIASSGREGDRLQAVAWIRLAADQGLAEARDLANRQQASLTPAESATVRTWMNQLAHKAN